MKCENCRFNKEMDYGIVKNICKITNVRNRTDCSLSSDEDVNKMEICFNCKHWFGGGDWGLSCAVDYYNCSSNGFERACEKFERKSV